MEKNCKNFNCYLKIIKSSNLKQWSVIQGRSDIQKLTIDRPNQFIAAEKTAGRTLPIGNLDKTGGAIKNTKKKRFFKNLIK